MSERLEVVHALGHVGMLERARGRITFTYDDEWRERDDATPVSMSMPLTARNHPPGVVEAFLWGLLPDNDAVLRRWARDFGVSVGHPFGLVTVLGKDLPGAMRFVHPESLDADDAGSDVGERGSVEWLSDDDVAELLRAVRRDHTAWLGPGSEGRWSLAGAQAKIALLRDGDRWGRPCGRLATTHILKPAIAGLDDHDLNEHLCLAAARRLGMRTVSTSIATFEEERAIVVERYDRRRGADCTPMRLHQEDLCQALGVHPSDKYQSDGGPGPAEVVRLLRDHVRPYQEAEASIGAFLDALAYNWIIAGPDGHAKNDALLLAGRSVRLAPFYDIASALPYSELYEAKVRLAMKIGSYDRVSVIRRSAWERLARELRLEPASVVERVRSLAERVPEALSEVCTAPSVTSLDSPLPERLLDAVADRTTRCLATLTG